MGGTILKIAPQFTPPVVTLKTLKLIDFRMYPITRNLVFYVKPVPKLGNIVPKLKKKIWLPSVVIKETGGKLSFFLATC